mmetsp:Transcript_39810/g.71312  ORF Transcript_39810/g.71312 Transcript_39810/m.71312 type:complete len:211 (-) Transcript_39810:611-1243(-)
MRLCMHRFMHQHSRLRRCMAPTHRQVPSGLQDPNEICLSKEVTIHTAAPEVLAVQCCLCLHGCIQVLKQHKTLDLHCLGRRVQLIIYQDLTHCPVLFTIVFRLWPKFCVNLLGSCDHIQKHHAATGGCRRGNGSCCQHPPTTQLAALIDSAVCQPYCLLCSTVTVVLQKDHADACMPRLNLKDAPKLAEVLQDHVLCRCWLHAREVHLSR